VRRRRIFNNVSFFGALFLGISLLLSAGTFGYKYLIQNSLDNARALLATEKGKFSEADLNIVASLNQHIDAAKFLLDRHAAPSKVFAALEESTKESVQYTEFLLRRHSSGNVTVMLKGATNEFGKIALQNLQYVEQDILKGAVVTGIAFAVDSEEDTESVSDEQIIFNVSTSVSVSEVGYTAAPEIAEPSPVEEIEVLEGEDTDVEEGEDTVPKTESTDTEDVGSDASVETEVTEEETL